MKKFSNWEGGIIFAVVSLGLLSQCVRPSQKPSATPKKEITMAQREDVMLRTCFPDGIYKNVTPECPEFRRHVEGEANLAEAEFNQQQKD